MHVLVASPYLPYPPFEGGRAAQLRTFEALRGACRFTLVVPIYSAAERLQARKFAALFPEITLRCIPCYSSRLVSWPVKAVRILQRLLFPPATSPAQRDLPLRPPPAPAYPFAPLPRQFIAAIDEELAKEPDLFQAEFAEMLTLGPLLQNRMPSVFIHHQLHFVYAQRFHDSADGDAYSNYLSERMATEERSYLQTFDHVVTFSRADQQSLGAFCPSLEIAVSPFPSPQEPPSVAARVSSPVSTFIFVATEAHFPNVDGLRWFMKEVWGRIRREIPEAKIEVVGKWSLAGRRQFAHHEDIHFHGYVEDLSAALRGKIAVVPIRIGSGIRSKILSAWSASAAVVTTSIGAEGLPGRPGRDFLVGDNAEAFSAACLELARDGNRFNLLCENGLRLVRDHYSMASVRATRMALYHRMLGSDFLNPAENPQQIPGPLADGPPGRGHHQSAKASNSPMAETIKDAISIDS